MKINLFNQIIHTNYFSNLKYILIFTNNYSNMINVNENIRYLRKKNGWTQEKFSKKIGIKKLKMIT